MKSTVIAFAGKIGSGKTTLSAAVAKNISWPRASFGDYVRKEAIRRGLGESREVLQKIGASLIEKDTEKFCLSVLDQVAWMPGQNVVIDGIRHSKVLRSLSKLTRPSEVLLIFVNVDDFIRMKRIRKQNASDRNNKFPHFEEHSTEAEVKTVLPELADLIVDGTRSKQDLVQEIVSWIQNKITGDKCQQNRGRAKPTF